MIVRITGTLTDVGEDAIVVEHDSVAREVLVPRYAIGELAAHRGKTVTLHTIELFEESHSSGHLVPRLLGFLHMEDRVFFTRFVSVKGIGPRKALKALAEPVRQIATWIEAGDAKPLSKLPGIGTRGAELIVASLKGKLRDMAFPASTPSAEVVKLSQAQRDALEVLVAWGDPRGEAERWLQRAIQLHPAIDSADEWVRVAYRVKGGVEG